MTWTEFARSFWRNNAHTLETEKMYSSYHKFNADNNEDEGTDIFYDCVNEFGPTDSLDKTRCANSKLRRDATLKSATVNEEGKATYFRGPEEEQGITNVTGYTSNILSDSDNEEESQESKGIFSSDNDCVIHKHPITEGVKNQVLSDSGVGSSSWSDSNSFSQASEISYGGEENCFAFEMEDDSDRDKFQAFEDDFGLVCSLADAGQYVNALFNGGSFKPQWCILDSNNNLSVQVRIKGTLSRVSYRGVRGTHHPYSRQ